MVDGDSAVGRLRMKVSYAGRLGPDQVAISDPSNDKLHANLTEIAVSSEPENAQTYNEGDVIEVMADSTEGAEVAGTPQLALTIGDYSMNASHDRVEASSLSTCIPSQFHFTCTVQKGDTHEDGIHIGAKPINLNGGTIADFGGNDATLTINALGTLEEHKVDSPEVGGL